MSEEEAIEAFIAIRYHETDGEPYCHRCGCAVVYQCDRTVKNRKMEHRDILYAIGLVVNGAKGKAALHLGRDLNVQHKTAFVLEGKIREALGALQHTETLSGKTEVDAAHYGGYVKPATRRKNRRDRRQLANQFGKRRAVTVARERNGRTRAFVMTEREFADIALDVIERDSILYTDEAKGHDALESIFVVRRINHDESYAEGEVSTNWAESMHSRMRRAENGVFHHIAGPYLDAYADEMTWREDFRRVSNGEQFLVLTSAALHHPPSQKWKGVWQRRKEAA